MKSILLIDDDPQILKALQRVLSPHSNEWECTAVIDKHDAVALMRHRDFDLIITDILLPGLGGLEILGEVRRRLPLAKIVAIRGAGVLEREEFLNIAELLGAHATLEKPFPPEVFMATVRELLRIPAIGGADSDQSSQR